MSLLLAGKPFTFLQDKRLTLPDYSFGIPDGFMAAQTEDDYEFFMWYAEDESGASSDRIIFFAGPFLENELANRFGVDAWSSFFEFEYFKSLSIASEEEKPLRYEIYRNRQSAAIIKEMSEGIYHISVGGKRGAKQFRIQIKDEQILKEFSWDHMKAWIDTIKLSEPIDEGKQINDSTFFGSELTEALADEICDNLQRKVDIVNRVFVMKKELMTEKQSVQKVDPITAQKEMIALVEDFTAEMDKLMNQAFFMYRALNLANRGNENLTKIRKVLDLFEQYKMVEIDGPLAPISRESRLNREPDMFDLPEFSDEPEAEEMEGMVSVSQVSGLASRAARLDAQKAQQEEKEEAKLAKPDIYLAPDQSVMPKTAEEEEKAKKKKGLGAGSIIAIIIGLILWLVACAAGVYYLQTEYLPRKHYEKAMTLYDSEKYMQAYEEFKLAGSYSDATWRMEGCQKKLAEDNEEQGTNQ